MASNTNKIKNYLGFYPETITEDALQKKYLKRIFGEQEKQRFLSLYDKTPEGEYRIRKEMVQDKKKAKLLNKLKKEMKSNVGFLRLGKIFVLGAIIAVPVAFNAFFLDGIVASLTVSALEGVFGAKAEVQGAHLDLFSMDLSYKRIAVADKEDPWVNLFDIGGLKAELDSNQLIKGRWHIENLGIDSFQWKTPRTSSGALLPKEADKIAETKSEEGAGLLEGAAGIMDKLGLKSFDPKALLESERDKLKLTALSLEAVNTLGVMTGDFQGYSQELAELSASLGPQVGALKVPQVSTVADIPKIQKFISDVQVVQKTMETAKNRGQVVQAEIAKATKQIASYPGQFQTAYQADFDYLKSFLPLPGGSGGNYLTPLLEKTLGPQTLQYLSWGQQALEFGKSLKGQGNDTKPASIPMFRYEGKVAPGTVIPGAAFQINHLYFGSQKQNTPLWISVDNISTDPDVTGKPITAVYHQQLPFGPLDVKTSLDLRTQGTTPLDLSMSLKGIPVDLSQQSSILGLKEFAGSGDLSTSYAQNKDGTFLVQGNIDLKPTTLTADPGNPIGGLIKDLLGRRSVIPFEIMVSGQPKAPQFSFSSPLEQDVSRLAGEYLEKAKKEALDRLNKALKNYLGQEEGVMAENRKLLEKYLGVSLSNIGSLDDLDKKLQELKAAAEKKIADIKAEADQKVLNEARKVQEQAKTGAGALGKQLGF